MLFRLIHRNSLILGIVFLIAAWRMGGMEMAGYTLLGILLSIWNARWLLAGIDRLLMMPSRNATGLGLIVFFGRLGLIMICLYATIRVSLMGALACLAGLSVHVLGAMITSLWLACLSFRKQARNPR